MARVLVVDDEELAQFTIREILEDAGHDVCEAENGNQAIAEQQSQPFDLIITDIIMPEKEGVETIVELMAEFPDLKIIGISGGGRTRNLDYLQSAKQVGAKTVLSKPFTEDELLEAVESLL
jgi:CheY-like chemotaxis protein